jgi:hypothetical protein
VANTFDQIEEEVKKSKQIDEAAALKMFEKFLKSM